ncbi:GNAT family N-acetyltransferase [Pseudalkalibacillus decolorationis]|uniref:GNAT family N-acetyltransferase n=1 Tax=Pseudalkalibacillus decolorationis TaxID=163879 RepID=UPI0021491D13|nr:GNAT family N-acetyltransferase [Pseudalkalibacillus decolorationis]
MKIITWTEDKLQDVLCLWNKEIGDQFPMREELLKLNCFEDENVLLQGSFLAVDSDDKLIGFVVSKRWQENLNLHMGKSIGWIQVLLVDSDYRNLGLGSRLLEKAETALIESGATKVSLGRDPWYYFPGVPGDFHETRKWFENRGYTSSGQDFDLICHYDKAIISPPPSFDEVEFAILEKGDQEEFITFLHRCFPGRWEYEAIHYFKRGGTGREFVVLKKGRKIIGFCRINDHQSPFIVQNVYWSPLFSEPLGGIGPLGIDPNERKKGYGMAIVEAGIAILREREINRIVIDWTGLVEFYGKLGYDVWKAYHKYEKLV